MMNTRLEVRLDQETVVRLEMLTRLKRCSRGAIIRELVKKEFESFEKGAEHNPSDSGEMRNL